MMKYVPLSQAQRIEVTPACTVYEYGGSDALDGAVAEINGRYPGADWAMNMVSAEMIFVLEGTGELIAKTRRVPLEKAAMVFIEPGEVYYFEGESLRVFLACTPAWSSSQHRVVT